MAKNIFVGIPDLKQKCNGVTDTRDLKFLVFRDILGPETSDSKLWWTTKLSLH